MGDEKISSNDPTIIQTDVNAKNGQNKCPKCGATDISTDVKTGKLRCNFCRFEFDGEKLQGLEEDVSNLRGEVIASGAQNRDLGKDTIITLKCTSCGAEVVVDTNEATSARCHWCRNTLSINTQVPNGAVPDVILPFKLSKKDAEGKIREFVNARRFFANPTFKKEFTTENIMGVYFPYMIVDVNGHSHLFGKGEVETRRYTEKHGDHTETYYDADEYDVERDFDLEISGLTIESNVERLQRHTSDKTNNIINSIMPFDIENAVKWDANYIKGFTSEKRDTDINQIKPIVDAQTKDIARFAANDTIKKFDRGVRWTSESFDVRGRQWKSAYLPVWLYSYMQKKGSGTLLHYVAVNARTLETMGSVPINYPKLILFSIIIGILGIFTKIQFDFKYYWGFFIAGAIFYAVMYSKYRNNDARHTYERETKKTMKNLKANEQKTGHHHHVRNSRIEGANNTSITGAYKELDDK